MLEMLETFFTTASFFNIFSGLGEMAVAEIMVVFLLSKPLFVIIALGAVLSGRKWGEAHYLHHQECDRFLSQSFCSGVAGSEEQQKNTDQERQRVERTGQR